jgi:hypothetical protein
MRVPAHASAIWLDHIPGGMAGLARRRSKRAHEAAAPGAVH